ncbi:MaoC like domain-containing protein [Pseudooceanicola nitratireducens]|jgi:acyl dehydratase|uniref:MaoC like domain-containing protein n=1 Tax=Pseudooceanicola nitratireducens TaxID=517719 RepID=A0A1I1NV60_9RHOB|nr:MaoC family dehydratase [Pseudooceanicola nitratireducens]SEI64590.1 MaoC like domain-containing protein [Pseudooceanicola nitratireducens]SFD01564.1 MaoC like domain-containing protein [Pseudooceanicola nitratireducens]
MTYPDTIPALTIQSTPEAAQAYAALTQDWNPIHLDADFAADTPFGRPIAHGTMALNLLVEAIARAGLRIADLDIRFSAPTYVGQSLTATARHQGAGSYEVTVLAEGETPVLTGRATLKARG